MPARDVHHDLVRRALIKDGWRITHDPLSTRLGPARVFLDIGAEAIVTAEKEGRRIGIEVKGMTGRSPVTEFERALGQYLVYRSILSRVDREVRLYLAVPARRHAAVFDTALGRAVSDDYHINYVLYDPRREVVTRWIASMNSGASSAPS